MNKAQCGKLEVIQLAGMYGRIQKNSKSNEIIRINTCQHVSQLHKQLKRRNRKHFNKKEFENTEMNNPKTI